MLGTLAQAPGQRITLVCQDWANTKAAYRFLSNERVSEAEILAGYVGATRERIAALEAGPVLMLHDTTEFSWKRDSPQSIGLLGLTHSGRDAQGHLRHHTVCSIQMHSSLAVTLEGLPLGLAAIKFWTRSKFKGTNALKRLINPTRVPIEKKERMCWLGNVRQASALFECPAQCVHIGDRGSDIYELFCQAHDLGTHFIFRTCADRLAGDGTQTVATYMQQVRCRGLHRLEVRDAQSHCRCAVLELRYCRAEQNRYRPLTLTVLQASERNAPEDVEPIDWKLITDLPVRSRAQAIEKIDWYAMRWKIELFHKILKSGCRAEESRLRTAQRLTNLIALLCILSVCVRPRHLEMTWSAREHRVHGEGGEYELVEGSGTSGLLAVGYRTGRVHCRQSGGGIGLAPCVGLSQQGATDAAAIPRSDCSTASAGASERP